MRGMCFIAVLLAGAAAWAAPLTEHPRLFLTRSDGERLRGLRADGVHAAIWANLAKSADWCLTKSPRAEWIAPVSDDPNYENLYDRFYAMMQDMAITEHLAFAYALSGDEKYGNAAHAWVLGCCRAWKPDADAPPDGGKAYAVMRLLKGVATGYDLAHDRFTPDERDEIRAMLATTGRNYFENYFQSPARSGAAFHTHHAIVEYSSFGIAALALLGEVDDAGMWVDAVTKKFEDHLLPMGLAEDGAQIEGATFWASTMQYRLFYMDALRRVTGKDLFLAYAKYMNADLALASIAAEGREGWDEAHQSVVLSPSYGQINYYAPVLIGLAREYKRPIYHYLGTWDKTLGAIQQTKYVTPNRREQLLFALGGYAYVWYDARVQRDNPDAPLSYRFPSVGQVYARGSWSPGNILVAIDKSGQLVVHAGGTAVLIASGPSNDHSSMPVLTEDGTSARIDWQGPEATTISILLIRPDRVQIRCVGPAAFQSFWSLQPPELQDENLLWPDRAQARIMAGSIRSVDKTGYAPDHAVGNGRLTLIDPAPIAYPVISISPDTHGVFEIEFNRMRQK